MNLHHTYAEKVTGANFSLAAHRSQTFELYLAAQQSIMAPLLMTSCQRSQI